VPGLIEQQDPPPPCPCCFLELEPEPEALRDEAQNPEGVNNPQSGPSNPQQPLRRAG